MSFKAARAMFPKIATMTEENFLGVQNQLEAVTAALETMTNDTEAMGDKGWGLCQRMDEAQYERWENRQEKARKKLVSRVDRLVDKLWNTYTTAENDM